MTKKESLTAKSDKELQDLLLETRASLRTERFAASGSRAKDSSAALKLRKVRARVLTEQGRRAATT